MTVVLLSGHYSSASNSCSLKCCMYSTLTTSCHGGWCACHSCMSWTDFSQRQAFLCKHVSARHHISRTDNCSRHTCWNVAREHTRLNQSCCLQHWSSRKGSSDRRKSLWCGWAVMGAAQRFWFAGDTGYCGVFKEIGEKYGPFDLSAIPIGAYNPRYFMKPQHVDPSEAVQIHQV